MSETQQAGHGAVAGQVERKVRLGAEALQPVAYLYHDAASAETANPMLHSTLVVMASDRRPTLRNETPLVTLAQAQAMEAAERERCAAEENDACLGDRRIVALGAAINSVHPEHSSNHPAGGTSVATQG